MSEKRKSSSSSRSKDSSSEISSVKRVRVESGDGTIVDVPVSVPTSVSASVSLLSSPPVSSSQSEFSSALEDLVNMRRSGVWSALNLLPGLVDQISNFMSVPATTLSSSSSGSAVPVASLAGSSSGLGLSSGLAPSGSGSFRGRPWAVCSTPSSWTTLRPVFSSQQSSAVPVRIASPAVTLPHSGCAPEGRVHHQPVLRDPASLPVPSYAGNYDGSRPSFPLTSPFGADETEDPSGQCWPVSGAQHPVSPGSNFPLPVLPEVAASYADSASGESGLLEEAPVEDPSRRQLLFSAIELAQRYAPDSIEPDVGRIPSAVQQSGLWSFLPKCAEPPSKLLFKESPSVRSALNAAFVSASGNKLSQVQSGSQDDLALLGPSSSYARAFFRQVPVSSSVLPDRHLRFTQDDLALIGGRSPPRKVTISWRLTELLQSNSVDIARHGSALDSVLALLGAVLFEQGSSDFRDSTSPADVVSLLSLAAVLTSEIIEITMAQFANTVLAQRDTLLSVASLPQGIASSLRFGSLASPAIFGPYVRDTLSSELQRRQAEALSSVRWMSPRLPSGPRAPSRPLPPRGRGRGRGRSFRGRSSFSASRSRPSATVTSQSKGVSPQ